MLPVVSSIVCAQWTCLVNAQIASYSTLYACACKPRNQVTKLCVWASPACMSQGLALMPSHVGRAFVCTHLCLESVIMECYRVLCAIVSMEMHLLCVMCCFETQP